MKDAPARIEAAIAVARRMADAGDALGQAARARLPDASGLSPEGVELALREHLEVAPAPDEIDALLRKARPTKRCHVVLSANVCTAALRAIAWALAGTSDVIVKPSHRDPVLAEIFAAELGLPLAQDIAPRDGDSVHVYGADETIAAIAATLPSRVVLRGHGTGFGVAVGDDPVAIADDLVPFDGRGCLSPRLVIASGDPSQLGAALHEELDVRGGRVPRGPLSAEDRAALTQCERVFATIGEVHVGAHHLVLVDPAPRAITLAPALRATVVVSAAAVPLLASVAHHVAAVGGADGALVAAIQALCPRARRSPLGRMQKPPLDGPVDLR